MLLQKKVITRFAIYAFLFIGLLSSYACQESSWTEDIEISTQTDEKPGDQTVLKRPTPPENPSEVLERRMQWASYIAAKVLCQDAEARTEVMELLMVQESEYLDLNQLLLTSEYTPTFRTLFINQATYHLNNIDGEEQFFPEPSHNQAVPPSSRQVELSNVHQFIDFLTVDNCLELFFINAFIDDRGNHYFSTAHPLTTDEDNYGYEVLYSDGGFGQGNNSGSFRVEETVVTPIMATSDDKIIVCRPRRNTLENPACEYSEIGRGIDFTLFLTE